MTKSTTFEKPLKKESARNDPEEKPVNWTRVRFVLLMHSFLIFLFLVAPVFVVPKFVSIYEDFGANLPALTPFVFRISDFIKNGGYILFPFFWGLDAAFGLLIVHITNEKLFRIWSRMFLLAFILLFMLLLASLLLPLFKLSQLVS